MSVEGIKKAPGATGGVDLPLITNEEFAKWLVKEFKMGWKEANDKALHYSQDRKEVALLLKDWIPAISFRGIDNFVKPISPYIFDYISSDLRILEKYGISPSVALLEASPANLEKNLQELMERKRKLNEYVRASKLCIEHEKFKSYLDNVEGAVIKELHEKMPKIPTEAIEEFVNKTHLKSIEYRLKALENRAVDISAFTDIKEFSSAKLDSQFDRRELKGVLLEKMPGLSSKAVDELLERVYNDSRNFVPIARNVKTLEEQGVDLEKFTDADIRKLEEPSAYKKAMGGIEHKEDYLEELKRGLPAEPPEAVERFVNETRGNVITKKLNALKAWGITLSEVGSLERFNSPIGEVVSYVERQRFISYLVAETQIPYKDIEKVVDGVKPEVLRMRVNALAEKGKLKELSDANVLRESLTDLRARHFALAPEPSKVLAIRFTDEGGKLSDNEFYRKIGGRKDEKEAFKEIGNAVREKGRITQSEMEDIFRKHIGGDKQEVTIRLNKRVNFLVDEGIFEIEFIEKAE